MILDNSGVEKKDNHYEFTTEAPGADEGSLKVGFNGNRLSVQWTRRGRKRSNTFVLLTEYFDVPASSYTYIDGVVTVSVPLKGNPIFEVPLRA